MKKLFLSLLALFLFSSISFASGKMMIANGDNVVLNAESDLMSPGFKWILLFNDKIVNTQSNQQFSYVFEVEGKYQLNLVVESAQTQETENTSMEILVGRSQEFVDSLQIHVQSFPVATQDNIIFISEGKQDVSFVLNQSTGNIKDFIIDANIQVDSDLDGDAQNDVDNSGNISVSTGDLWTYNYSLEELPAQAKLSVFDVNGYKDERIFTIKKQELTQSVNQKPVAVLQSSPRASSDKRVHLNGEKQTVALFSSGSFGDLIEYRIDTDIYFDSNGDGDPANDIDNLSDPSFKTGSVFEVDLQRVFGEKIMQLIVVSAEGKGSRIQKKFVWDTDTDLIIKKDFKLISEKTEGFTGDVFYFGLEGLTLSDAYEVKWDFDGDQKTDLVSQESFVSFQYNNVGEYEVLVQIKNESAGLLKYATRKISIRNKTEASFITKAPIADFNVSVNGNEVVFTDTSIVDQDLQNKDLVYEWSFGDGFRSTQKSPVHSYSQIADFIVRLKVTDSSGQTHLKQEVISIQSLSPTITEDPVISEEEPVIEEPVIEEDPIIEEEPVVIPIVIDNPVDSSFSWIMLFVWIIFGGTAAVLISLGIYLFIVKVKNPDYSFSEIIEEEKEKFLSALEGREYEPPHGEIVAPQKEISTATQEILKESDKAQKIRNELATDIQVKKVETPEVTVEQKPVIQNPEPLKEVIQDAPVVAAVNPIIEQNPVAQKPVKQEEKKPEPVVNESILDDDIPDWLK